MVAASAGHAQSGDIAVPGRAVVPENVASTADGTIYVASFGKGGVYRASPGERTATPWISSERIDGGRTLGLWVDEQGNRLLACIVHRPPPGADAADASSIRIFSLDDATLRAVYGLGDAGVCNDLTSAPDDTIYATDLAGRIFRLQPSDSRFALWLEDESLFGADGLAMLDDGSLLVNSIRRGTLHRVPIEPSGEVGEVIEVTLDQPLQQPDGMRRVGPNKLLVAEGAGRLTELTISGDRAAVRVIRDQIADNPSGVTVVGGVAYVSLANWAAHEDSTIDTGEYAVLAVPYPPPD